VVCLASASRLPSLEVSGPSEIRSHRFPTDMFFSFFSYRLKDNLEADRMPSPVDVTGLARPHRGLAMHLDEKVLVDVALRLLRFYRLETGCEGTLDEANRWFAARSFASLDAKGRGEFLEAFLRNKTGDEQREDLMWLLGQRSREH